MPGNDAGGNSGSAGPRNQSRIGRDSRCSFLKPAESAEDTMLFMPTQISLYQEMSALSSRMVEAARANDWETLINLERSIAALRNSLLPEDDNGEQSAREVKLKSQLIQRILADDAEVRRHTEPWMEQIRRFLGSDAKRRAVENAYGADS